VKSRDLARGRKRKWARGFECDKEERRGRLEAEGLIPRRFGGALRNLGNEKLPHGLMIY
jgi:hypothetical protein